MTIKFINALDFPKMLRIWYVARFRPGPYTLTERTDPDIQPMIPEDPECHERYSQKPNVIRVEVHSDYRQIGKSTLAAKIAEFLVKEGYHNVEFIDNVPAEQYLEVAKATDDQPVSGYKHVPGVSTMLPLTNREWARLQKIQVISG